MLMGKVVMAMVVMVSILGFTADAEASTFDEVMQHYEPVRLALLEDSMNGVNDNGAAMADALRALKADFSAGNAGADGDAVEVVREKLPDMIEAADGIATAKSLEAARDAFYELTKPLVRWRQGVPADGRPKVAYCPMYKRSWLQPGEEIGNPYGGMPRCGEIVSQ
jgi:hypothetical protein